jgi:anionic cell wall polymer biosynthesis LytR-Cps2A-Psr (LCP) family protein
VKNLPDRRNEKQKEGYSMNKKVKTIISVVVIVVIVLAIIFAVSISTSKKAHNNGAGSETSATSTEITQAEETTLQAESVQESNKSDGTDETGNSDKETNYWDNVEVYEDGDSTENVTNEKGETVTEEYPGEDSGWSPIVSPDDLENNQ